jgi:DNA-binding PadR family transcriptional regulator
LSADLQLTNAVRKAILSVLYENKGDELSVERLYVKVLRHMLPKIPEEQIFRSVLDKLAKDGYVDFEEAITGNTIAKLSSKGIEYSEKELEQFKRTIDKIATKLGTVQ